MNTDLTDRELAISGILQSCQQIVSPRDHEELRLSGGREGALAYFGRRLCEAGDADTATKKAGLDACVRAGLISRAEADEIL